VNASKPVTHSADRRRALWHAAAAFASLVLGVLTGRLLHSDTVVWMSAVTGFFALAWFLRGALVLWEIDSPLFEDPDKTLRIRGRSRPLAGSPHFTSEENLEPGVDRER
jgi:hypothetical protein